MDVGAAKDDRQLEAWDRLTLLFIARPLRGWEREYEEITRREIGRLQPASAAEADDE